jgi:MSHA pilin protein MshC
VSRRLQQPPSRGRARLITGQPAPGFTTVELVVVIIVLAVITAVAAPRLVGRSAFESRAFADEVASAVRHAQRTAIAMRRSIAVVVGTPSVSQPCALRLCVSPDCSQQVVDPASSRNFCLVPPPLTTLSAAGAGPGSGTPGLVFDSRGRPSAPHSFSVSSSAPGVPARSIVVEAESGYVR